MVNALRQFRVHAHHLEVLSSESPNASAQIMDMINCLSEGGDFEDTLLEGLERYKQRFPEDFETIDPKVVDVMAAVFTFHGQLNELTRLEMLMTEGSPLHAGFMTGRARGAYVRRNSDKYHGRPVTGVSEPSDFADRPHNRTRVPV
jgi:hypothetical protein